MQNTQVFLSGLTFNVKTNAVPLEWNVTNGRTVTNGRNSTNGRNATNGRNESKVNETSNGGDIFI